jgi:hypothetical protein
MFRSSMRSSSGSSLFISLLMLLILKIKKQYVLSPRLSEENNEFQVNLHYIIVCVPTCQHVSSEFKMQLLSALIKYLLI